MLHEKIQTRHCKEHEQSVGAAILRERDVICHKSQSDHARDSNLRRKRPCEKIDHWNRKSSCDEGDNPEVPFWFFKGIEKMIQEEEKRRMKKGRILFIKFNLIPETVTRIIISMDFVQPK